jgi:hypothetical protein
VREDLPGQRVAVVSPGEKPGKVILSQDFTALGRKMILELSPLLIM